MNIEKIKPNVATATLCCAGNVFIVAFGIFLVYRPLFMSLELWRLLSICVAISIGSLLAMYIFMTMIDVGRNATGNRTIVNWAISGALSDSLFLILFFSFYLIGGSLRDVLIYAVIAKGICLTGSVMYSLFSKKSAMNND